MILLLLPIHRPVWWLGIFRVNPTARRAKFAREGVQQDSRGHGHVERARALAHRDRDNPPAPVQPVRVDPLVFLAHDQADPIWPDNAVERLGGRISHRGDQHELIVPGQVGNHRFLALAAVHGKPENRAHRNPHHPTREGVGTRRTGKNRIDTENVADPRDRAQVFGVREPRANHQGEPGPRRARRSLRAAATAAIARRPRRRGGRESRRSSRSACAARHTSARRQVR